MEKKIRKFQETFITILKKPEMKILPGQIAFYFLMSIVPIAAISAIAASYITKSFTMAETLNTVMPVALSNIIVSLSNNMHLQGMAFVTVLYALMASNAPSSIIIASNMLYDVKQPRYLKLKIKSFIMIIMIVVLLMFVILIPLLGDLIIKTLIELFKMSFLYNYREIYQIIKVIASCLIMYTILKLLYTIAPDKKIKSRTTTKGAIFTTISWILITYLFAFYITNIASYDAIYGNFANVLILLIWLYLLAYLFVIGMAINVDEFHKQGKCVNEKRKNRKIEYKKETDEE